MSTSRVFAFDDHGLIHVIERHICGLASVTQTWGSTRDSSESVLAASLSKEGLLAVSRANGEIQVYDSQRPEKPYFTKSGDANDPFVALHIFKQSEPTCSETIKGPRNVGNGKDILHYKVHEDEKYALFGGKGGLCVFDLENHNIIWEAEYDDRFRGTYISAATFQPGKSHGIIVGSDCHDIYLYDNEENTRRAFGHWEKIHYSVAASSIQGIVEGSNDRVYIGTSSGDIFSLNYVSGKFKYFEGIATGSWRFTTRDVDHRYKIPDIPLNHDIKFLVRHPDKPLMATFGNDGLKFWNMDEHKFVEKVNVDANINTVIFE